jgi:hypothetical protein
MKSGIPFCAIGLGFALLIASSLWTTIFPPTLSWTPEKAQRSAEIKDRLTNLGFALYAAEYRPHSGPDPGTLKAEYDALMKENAQLNADFTSATETPETISNILKWSGISLAALGIIGWYAIKQSS